MIEARDGAWHFIEILDLWIGLQKVIDLERLPCGDELGDFAIWIIEVTELNGLGNTRCGAGRCDVEIDARIERWTAFFELRTSYQEHVGEWTELLRGWQAWLREEVASTSAALKQEQDATREAQRELEEWKERARVHTELAAAYYGSGQYEFALEEVQTALEADDDYLPAVNQLGLIHLALGQTEDAKRELRRALRLDPDDPSVNNNYGMLLCGF